MDRPPQRPSVHSLSHCVNWLPTENKRNTLKSHRCGPCPLILLFHDVRSSPPRLPPSLSPPLSLPLSYTTTYWNSEWGPGRGSRAHIWTEEETGQVCVVSSPLEPAFFSVTKELAQCTEFAPLSQTAGRVEHRVTSGAMRRMQALNSAICRWMTGACESDLCCCINKGRSCEKESRERMGEWVKQAIVEIVPALTHLSYITPGSGYVTMAVSSRQWLKISTLKWIITIRALYLRPDRSDSVATVTGRTFNTDSVSEPHFQLKRRLFTLDSLPFLYFISKFSNHNEHFESNMKRGMRLTG